MTVIEQLENDQLEESQGDDLERAYRIGHNTAVQISIWILKLVDRSVLLQRHLELVTEHEGDAVTRAFWRGRNAGARHVLYVLDRDQERRERAECEAADEFASKSPVEFGLAELVEKTGGQQ